MPIRDYPTSSKNQVDPGIAYSEQFQGYEACVAAGLDLWRWENNLYPPIFRAKVIVWKEYHDLIENHIQDAVARKQEQGNKG